MAKHPDSSARFFWFALVVVTVGSALLALAIGALGEPRVSFPLAPKVAPSSR